MEGLAERSDALIRSGARRLTGYRRRSFIAEVTTELCGGSARRAERRFGWGRPPSRRGCTSPAGDPLCGELRRPRSRAARRRTRDWPPTSGPSSSLRPTPIRN